MKRPITWFKKDPNHPRTSFPKESLRVLADLIKRVGIIKPIEVDPSGMIIVGVRRWKAAKLAGYKELEEGKDFRINDKKMNEYELLRRRMIENVHQYADDPLREAWRMNEMLRHTEGNSYTSPGGRNFHNDKGIKKLSKELHIPYETIYRKLLLLEEPYIRNTPQWYYTRGISQCVKKAD